MPSPLSRALRRSASDPSFLVFLVTVVVCLLRARDLPSVDVGAGGTEFSIGPGDLGLVATAALAAARLRSRRTFPSRALPAAAALFALLIVVSALANGATAVAAAGKLAELAALTLGAAAFVDSRERLEDVAALLVGFCVLAAGWALVQFLGAGGRQGSFVGEHDLAAIAGMAVAVGLAHLHARPGRPAHLAVVALVAGGLGLTLAASLASLLGLYLAAAAVLALAVSRHTLRRAAVLVTVALAAAVTAGTLSLRSGDLGFLQSWFGPKAERPGEYAASWSQRLIYAYIGGRVFLDRPVLGTGWEGELPAEEYARYLPDAHARFSDQPPRYFPPANGTLIPQQTYDQVLTELGLVGGAVFAAVAGLTVWRALRTGLRWPMRTAAELGYLPLAWVGSLAGALAGAALFGGSPLAAVFWLTLGLVTAAGALPSRSPVPA